MIQPFIQKSSVACILTRIAKNYEENLSKYIKNPADLIVDASNQNKEKGSSTVVITTLDPSDLTLSSAFLGDSGYMIFRRKSEGQNEYDIIYHSEEQQHSFNYPFQVGTHGDDPIRSKKNVHTLQAEDIVLLATDGLFDNLYDNDIKKELETFLSKSQFHPEGISKAIADAAFKKSLDKKWKSPFQIKAEANYMSYEGGKSDDITVVIGRVELNND